MAVLLLAAPPAVEAQLAGKAVRIGVLSVSSPDGAPYTYALRDGLRDLGYLEGRNVTIEWRWARGQEERLTELAVELVHLRVDAIVAEGTPAVLAARRATGTIPIVMVNVADAVRQGLVASLTRPGGNITGLSSQTTDLQAKRLQLLKEVVPELARVATLQDAAYPEVRDAEAAARVLGVQLQRVKVRSPDEFDSAFAAITRERAQGLLVEASRLFIVHSARIQTLAAQKRLPTMCTARPYGCLMSYGVNFRDRLREAAIYVDKILKGAKPAELPVDEPTKFELVIDLKTAKGLGLTLPRTLLMRADHVIE